MIRISLLRKTVLELEAVGQKALQNLRGQTENGGPWLAHIKSVGRR